MARPAARWDAVHRRHTDLRSASRGRPACHADDHRGHHRAQSRGGFAAKASRARRGRGHISRRFLEGDLDEATRFAIGALASFFRVDADTVARWIETTGRRRSRDRDRRHRARPPHRRDDRDGAGAPRGRAGAARERGAVSHGRRTLSRRHPDLRPRRERDRTFASPAAERLIGLFGAGSARDAGRRVCRAR